MRYTKIANILFTAGIAVIIIGVLSGVAAGFLTACGGFNLLPAAITAVISLITGTGFITVSGAFSEAHEKQQNDTELLQQILEKYSGGDDKEQQ